jgi:hypothetical protein
MHWWRPKTELPQDGKLIVFPKEKMGNIPALARCEFRKTEEGWSLRMPRLLRPPIDYSWTSGKPLITPGMLRNQLTMEQFDFQFGKRYNQQLETLSARLDADCRTPTSQTGPLGNLSTEMA